MTPMTQIKIKRYPGEEDQNSGRWYSKRSYPDRSRRFPNIEEPDRRPLSGRYPNRNDPDRGRGYPNRFEPERRPPSGNLDGGDRWNQPRRPNYRSSPLREPDDDDEDSEESSKESSTNNKSSRKSSQRLTWSMEVQSRKSTHKAEKSGISACQ